MEEESNKEQIVVEISKLLNFDEERQEEFESWKEEIAEHRKIFTKYRTVVNEYLDFAIEDVLNFMLEVNNEFEFGLSR